MPKAYWQQWSEAEWANWLYLQGMRRLGMEPPTDLWHPARDDATGMPPGSQPAAPTGGGGETRDERSAVKDGDDSPETAMAVPSHVLSAVFAPYSQLAPATASAMAVSSQVFAP